MLPNLGDHDSALEVLTGPAGIFTVPSIKYPPKDSPSFLRSTSMATRGSRCQIEHLSIRSQIRSQGNSLDEGRATTLALGEAIERFCTTVYRDKELIISTADALEEHLSLSSLPVCSRSELLNPKCSLKSPSNSLPIHWVRGLSLPDGCLKWIPAVMVFMPSWEENRGERFWHPISTGCAAHPELETALLSALCEVVERDAIAITWLQMLGLPEINLDVIGDELAYHLALCSRASAHLEFRLFDATTDVGIPVVYGVRIARHATDVHTVVACSAAMSFETAICKVLRDLEAVAGALNRKHTLPGSFEEFVGPLHGAAYMAHKQRSHAFDFLLKSRFKTKLSSLATNPVRNLQEVLNAFRQNGREVYAVDLTTDEASVAGIKVVRVVIPSLQPLSFSYLAQYKGHPRLYSAPEAMGYTVRTEGELNSWPQPFA